MLAPTGVWTDRSGQAKIHTCVDFLLECIGFPPDHPLDDLVERVLREGEPAPWRGDARHHRRLALGAGLELRMDRSSASQAWNLLPYYQSPHRLRVSVESLRPLPDSPFDVLLQAWACPPIDAAERQWRKGAYRLCVNLVDARKLPRTLASGHVLAISTAGFALDVLDIGNAREADPSPWIEPLSGEADPGGCADMVVRIQSIQRFWNPITRVEIAAIEVEAPERPLVLFQSPWQLQQQGLEEPRVGRWIQGSFLFLGSVTGGLGRPSLAAGRNFG